jgi:hypothetical protein
VSPFLVFKRYKGVVLRRAATDAALIAAIAAQAEIPIVLRIALCTDDTE